MPTITQRVASDTWISQQHPDQNYSSYEFISTGRWPNAVGTGVHLTQGLWRFIDWGKIPDGANIIEAYLFHLPKFTLNDESSVRMEFHGNAQDWDPFTVTWNNDARTFFSAVLDSQPNTVGQWTKNNITNHIRNSRFAFPEQRDWGIRSIVYGTGNHGVDWHSLNASLADTRPYVRTTYNALAPSFSGITIINNNSQMQGDGAGVNSAAKVEVWWSTSSGGTFKYLKDATLSGDNWTFTDLPPAPAPAAPDVAASIVNGDEVKITWNYPSQGSVNRSWKTRRVLSDGTLSVFTSIIDSTLTPVISKWHIQRDTGSGWSTIATMTGVTTTSAREYIDTTLPLNTKGSYRVIAENSQTTTSAGDSTPPSVTIVPPAAPVIGAVDPINGNAFRITGTKAPTSGTRSLEIYVSADGTNYSLAHTISSTSTDAWTHDIAPTAIGTSPAYRAPNYPNMGIEYTNEKEINILWNYTGIVQNPGTKRWYKARNIVDGVESVYSSAVSSIITPTITGFKIDRKLESLSDAYYSQIFPSSGISSPDATGHIDTTVNFNEKYTYRIIAYNNIIQSNGLGMPSTPITKLGATQVPKAPGIFPTKILNNADGSQRIRISGNLRNNAPVMYVQKQDANLVWSDIPFTVQLGTSDTNTLGEEWWIDDNNINVSKPSVPTWNLGSVPVDTSGIFLKWNVPTNDSVSVNYRALREMPGATGQPAVRGVPSSTVSGSIQPYITSYTIYRRSVLKEGQVAEPSDSVDFKVVTTIIPQNADLTPPTSFTHPSGSNPNLNGSDVLPERTYVYKMVARNNFGNVSSESAEISVTTFDRPPAIIPPAELPPTVRNPRPAGSINVSGGGVIRFVWDYTHPENKVQSSYSLMATWTENGIQKQMHWNNTSKSWDLNATSRIFNSRSDNFVDVLISDIADPTIKYFKNGIKYKLSLKTRSSLSAGGSGTFTINATEGESETLEWDITGAEIYTNYFPTRRGVTRRDVATFDLYRKVTNAQDTALGLPVLAVSWNVEPQLPLEVSDENWEGAGNSWIHTVFDYDGRPEPFAEIDFEREGYNKSFQCDSRGRIVLNIPGDIEPGTYTFRERGPTMSPRTTRDFSLVDPGIIYNHGHRHASDGADPIFGLTNVQFADDANIHPSRVEGGESLGELVDAYGGNIQEGLERTISAGHGYYVIDGLDSNPAPSTTPSTIINGIVSISSGTCWENERLRELENINLFILEDGLYKIFVQGGIVKMEERNSHPPKSTPLYTLVVSGIATSIVVTDDRLRHPNNIYPSNAESVKWGVETTDDIKHNNQSLREVLDHKISIVSDRNRQEVDLHNKFHKDVESTSLKINKYNADVSKSKEAMLSIGYASTMKHLYSLWSRGAAENILLNNSTELQSANMIDVINYLSAIKNGGNNPKSSHISAFRSGDELSSLTNILIVNGLGRLPHNWVKGTQYTLRTLRIEGAPSKTLEFHLAYEDTKANFIALGSLNNNGRYIPKRMISTRIVRDDNLKDIFGTTNNCFINTYRAEFEEPGKESVIELLCSGGNPGDGIKLRGFAVVTA